MQDGMALKCVVSNVTKFGAFVDIGAHQDDLEHISEISNRFIRTFSLPVKAVQEPAACSTRVTREAGGPPPASMDEKLTGSRRSGKFADPSSFLVSC